MRQDGCSPSTAGSPGSSRPTTTRRNARFAQALSIAEREDDAALERRTLANAAFVDAFHLRWPDCLARGLRAIELAQHAGDPHTEIPARRAVAFALTATGEREQARLHTAAALAHAEPLRESWWLTSTSFSNALLCLYEGDWRAAREMSELGLAARAAGSSPPRAPRCARVRARRSRRRRGLHRAGCKRWPRARRRRDRSRTTSSSPSRSRW